MQLATRFSFWAPPDSITARVGRKGELFAAQVRVGATAFVTLIPIWEVVFVPDVRSWIGLGYALLTVLVGVVLLFAARRREPARWLGTVTCLLDVAIVSALHVAFLLGVDPMAAVKSHIGLGLYLLALAFTCLRQDVRLCLLAGISALVEYGGIVAWLLQRSAATGVPLRSAEYGTFHWSGQISRLALFAVVTAIDVAIVHLSRSYLQEMARQVEERTQELQWEKARAEAASGAKSELLAKMSYEIRTPLNAILGLTGLVLNSPLDPDQREQIEMARGSGEVLLAVLSDILDLSRIEAGTLAIDITAFSPRACADEAVRLVSARWQSRRPVVRCQFAATVPEAILSDELRLRQILVNLLDHAIQSGEGRDIHLEAESGGEEDDGAIDLTYTVREAGIRMESRDRDRLSKPFEQVDSTGGLGLAISHRLAERLGGKMWAEGGAGRGPVFSFTIHCRPATTKADA